MLGSYPASKLLIFHPFLRASVERYVGSCINSDDMPRYVNVTDCFESRKSMTKDTPSPSNAFELSITDVCKALDAVRITGGPTNLTFFGGYRYSVTLSTDT